MQSRYVDPAKPKAQPQPCSGGRISRQFEPVWPPVDSQSLGINRAGCARPVLAQLNLRARVTKQPRMQTLIELFRRRFGYTLTSKNRDVEFGRSEPLRHSQGFSLVEEIKEHCQTVPLAMPESCRGKNLLSQEASSIDDRASAIRPMSAVLRFDQC